MPPPTTHPSRTHLLPSRKPPPSKSRRKQKPAFIHGPARPKAHKVGPLKRRIRDLTRLLAQERRVSTLPAGVWDERARELRALRTELRGEERECRRRDMVGRYHMVRFFERKRAERNLKKAARRYKSLTASSSAPSPSIQEIQEAESCLQQCEVDLAYTKFYPLVVPYVSLYPKAARDGAEEEHGKDEAPGAEGEEKGFGPSMQGDRQMWARVEQAMREGAEALDRLREGGEEDDDEEADEERGQAVAERNVGRTKVNGVKAAGVPGEEADGGEDSDEGGFFD